MEASRHHDDGNAGNERRSPNMRRTLSETLPLTVVKQLERLR